MKFISAAFLIAAAFLHAHAVPTSDAHHKSHVRDSGCGYPQVPLVTAFNPTIVDHFYTINEDEMDIAVTKEGYIDESVAAYVYNSSDVPYVVPLYHLYSSADTDNYMTASWDEVLFATANDGYVYSGITAYAYEEALCSTVPLYRMFNGQKTDHYYTTSEKERYAMKQQGYADEGITAYVYADTDTV